MVSWCPRGGVAHPGAPGGDGEFDKMRAAALAARAVAALLKFLALLSFRASAASRAA